MGSLSWGHTKRRLGLALAIAAAPACLALAAPARASTTQELIFQDDPRIVFASSSGELDRTFATLRAIGVDRVRVSVFWWLVAPKYRSQRRPSFGRHGPSWPGSYPQSNWERYDRIVKLAVKHKLGLLFTITGPAPSWATPGKAKWKREGIVRPSARGFRQFVTAVGTRYSGFYDDPDRPAATPAQPRDEGITITIPGLPDIRLPAVTLGDEPDPVNPVPQVAAGKLPRVDHWSIWNEPNFPTWLSPQWRKPRSLDPNKMVPVTPRLYRGLVDAAWKGLTATTHRYDAILLGETAPRGDHDPRNINKPMYPLEFMRELYCLNRRYRPYRGRKAKLRGCPNTASERRSFISDHPALFNSAGWGHHPYSLVNPPTWNHPSPSSIPLGSLNRMINTLDRVFFRWGSTGTPQIWITEYGYQTKPPDPYIGVSWTHQAEWMSWAEELTYRNPRVESFAQFLLVDDAPRKTVRRTHKNYWITWQSGLFTFQGQKKPYYEEFQRPIHVTRRGGQLTIFGAYRPARNGVVLRARVEHRPAEGAWSVVQEATVGNPRGYLRLRIPSPGQGFVRIVWTDPASGAAMGTRPVFVQR